MSSPPLLIALEFPPRPLVVQESPLCRVTLSNPRDVPAEVRDPDSDRTWPRILVTTTSGTIVDPPTSEVGSPLVAGRDPFGPRTVTLAPGETRSWGFALLDRVSLLEPGEYLIRAMVDWGGQKAYSKSVAVRIVAVATNTLFQAYPKSLVAQASGIAWVQRGEPARLHFQKVEFPGWVRVAESLAIAEVDSSIVPALSAAPSRAEPFVSVVAWIDRASLRMAYVAGQEVRSVARRLPTSGTPRHIVSPFRLDPRSDTSRVAIWYEEAGEAFLCSFLCGNEVALERRVPMGRRRLLWSQGFFASDDVSRVVLIVDDHGETVLCSATWSKEQEFLGVEELERWPWRFVGSAGLLDGEDRVHGLIVGVDQGGELRRQRWLMGAMDQFRLHPADGWPEVAHANEIVARVDREGEVHALVQAREAEARDAAWTYRGPKGLYPLATRDGHPVGRPVLVFLGDGTLPLVLQQDRNRGLIGTPIGFKLYDPLGPENTQPPLKDA